MQNKPPALSDAQRQRFIEIRRRGRARYVLYFGVLRFGGLWAFLMAVLWYFLLRGYYPPLVSHSLPRIVAMLIFWLPFGILAGFVYGWWMWRIFERNTRSMAEEPPAGAPA